MKIVLEVIPHEKQRLGEPGDWFFDKQGDLQVRVSDSGDWRFNFLVARHEMDEAILCKYNGITTEVVDYDQKINSGSDKNDPDSYSGYPGSPIQRFHNDALAAEWQMGRLLDVNWEDYGIAWEKFFNKKEKK
jgi:hypothetical protein